MSALACSPTVATACWEAHVDGYRVFVPFQQPVKFRLLKCRQKIFVSTGTLNKYLEGDRVWYRQDYRT